MTAPTLSDVDLRDRVQALLGENDPASTPTTELRGAIFDAGLANVHHPAGQGGLGLSSREHQLVHTALRAGGVPDYELRTVVGHGMAAPTIVAHGSDEQRERWLRRIFTGEDIWCQLFSEPAAGSDLAAVATRAVRDGEDWVVRGQKVWTSFGQYADYGILLARTDPDVPKHQGLTYSAIPMRQPGVRVRPLRQMTGQAEFNEVSFDEARVGDANRIGAVGEGWRVAMTTLMSERQLIGGEAPARNSGFIGRALRLWHAKGDDERALWRDRVLDAWIEAEALRLTNLRTTQAARAGRAGPDPSIAKVQTAEQRQALADLCVDLLGQEGLLYDYEAVDPAGPYAHQWELLRSRTATIEGGTSEILRTVTGERVLGLPPEPRVDKALPWNQTQRG